MATNELRTSWVYTLRKDALIAHLTSFGIEAKEEDKVEDLRVRFKTFLQGQHSPETSELLFELQTQYEEARPSTSRGPTPEPPTRVAETVKVPIPTPTIQNIGRPTDSNPVSRRAILDIVRKWNISYNGGPDPFSFLERIEEMAETYEIELDLLPATMPQFLREKALTWFRNNNKHWRTWKEFKQDLLKFFTSPRYLERAEDEVRARKQRPNELFKDYVLDLQSKMRLTMMTEEEKLRRTYYNALPEYLRYIKRNDFTTLPQLLELAGDFEDIPPAIPRAASSQETHHFTNLETVDRVDPSTACRRCGQSGHRARGCTNPQRLFCWRCGRMGTRTVQCCLRTASENSSRARVQTGAIGPQSRQQRPTTNNQS